MLKLNNTGSTASSPALKYIKNKTRKCSRLNIRCVVSIHSHHYLLPRSSNQEHSHSGTKTKGGSGRTTTCLKTALYCSSKTFQVFRGVALQRQVQKRHGRGKNRHSSRSKLAPSSEGSKNLSVHRGTRRTRQRSFHRRWLADQKIAPFFLTQLLVQHWNHMMSSVVLCSIVQYSSWLRYAGCCAIEETLAVFWRQR